MTRRLTGLQKKVRTFIDTNLVTYLQTIISEEELEDVPVVYYVRDGYTDPMNLEGAYPGIMTYLESRKPTGDATKGLSLNVIIAVKASDPALLEKIMEAYADAFKEMHEDEDTKNFRFDAEIVDSVIREELFFSPLTGGDIAVINFNLLLEINDL